MTDTCAGACCSVFPLQISHPSFRKGPLKGDAAYIADMLIPLTRRQALRRSRKLGFPDPPKYPKDYHLFTCKHWDAETRLCGAYDQRPDMCRSYPYTNRECERGCGYKLTQGDHDAKAERADSPWVWDDEAKGWRPRSTSSHVWNSRRRLMLKREGKSEPL